MTIEVIERYDWSGGYYEWSTAEIGKDSEGRYWIRSGSGCSCSDITEEEWEPLRDSVQIHSKVDFLQGENEDLPKKAEFIAYVQGLL
jgi:hypothetical protein